MTVPHTSSSNPQISSESTSESKDTPALAYAGDPSPEQQAALPTIQLTQPDASGSYEDRCRQTLLLAEEAFAKTGSWVVFFRAVLGVGGVVQTLFLDLDERRRFIDGPEHAALHEMLAAVRSQDTSKANAAEPERMITIRIPKSLHELLVDEAKGCNLSINKLCISKLLQPANDRFVPEQQGRRRGRRPGPQSNRSQRDEVLANESASRTDAANRLSNAGANLNEQEHANQVSLNRFGGATSGQLNEAAQAAEEPSAGNSVRSWGG